MIFRLRVGLALGRFVSLASISSGKRSQNGIFLRGSAIAGIDSDLMIFPALMTTAMVTPILGPLKVGIKVLVKTAFPIWVGARYVPSLYQSFEVRVGRDIQGELQLRDRDGSSLLNSDYDGALAVSLRWQLRY